MVLQAEDRGTSELDGLMDEAAYRQAHVVTMRPDISDVMAGLVRHPRLA